MDSFRFNNSWIIPYLADSTFRGLSPSRHFVDYPFYPYFLRILHFVDYPLSRGFNNKYCHSLSPREGASTRCLSAPCFSRAVLPLAGGPASRGRSCLSRAVLLLAARGVAAANAAYHSKRCTNRCAKQQSPSTNPGRRASCAPK